MTKKFSYTFNYREEPGSQQPSEIVVYREEHLLEPEDRFHERWVDAHSIDCTVCGNLCDERDGNTCFSCKGVNRG